jgi:hypothetical protein
MPANRSPSSIRASEAWRPGRDPKHRDLTRQRAPQRPASAGGLPAGLVDVDDRGCFDLLLEPGVRRGERLTGAPDDRVDRPGRELDPEQLTGELGRVTAGDTVPHGERHDRGPKPRPERRAGHAGGKLGPGLGSALEATHTVQAMLGHPHRHRRQLGVLVARRFCSVNPFSLTEEVRARPAALRPMLDDLVDTLGRKQPTVSALMPKLTAPTSTRPLPAWTRRRRRRIVRGRQ